MGRIDDRLKELGVELPTPPAPVASYVPFVRAGNLVFLSGQISASVGKAYIGVVGKDVTQDDAVAAARLCAVNLLAQLKAAVDGDLDRVKRVVKLTGFVNAAPEFGNQPEVVNGASDLFVAVFGEAGKHARAAVGAGSLPRNMAVEVDGIFEVE